MDPKVLMIAYIALGFFSFTHFIAGTVADEDLVPVVEENDGPVRNFMLMKRYPDHYNAHLKSDWIKVGECPETGDGVKKFYCSSPAVIGKHVCIDDHQLCNGVKECPNAEDENPAHCMFHRIIKSQVQLLERSVQNFQRYEPRPPSRRYTHGIFRQDY